ncbi:MAG: 4-(cytidine 5'-diphospho)-2-C-methyl-D-erythritol kinase [Bacteroidetes bacterium]|nr:4-(cytidine 5'-diphospho)-2-C-methyl-D-erythritol kinase [Bacteroidota bacterium]
MITFPNAKINIGLKIIRKREDGFHDIETVMVPLKGILFDALEIISKSKVKSQSEGLLTEKSKIEILISGIKIQGEEKNNLCVKAYELLKKDFPLPAVKIFLHKAIPMGAGLGGGSADGAFMLKLLNEEFELGLAWGELHHYARQLGSDCSFFISNQPALAKGKGDELESIQLNLSGCHIAVVYPTIHVSTAEAYSMMEEWKNGRMEEWKTPQPSNLPFFQPSKLPIKKWKETIVNDFEKVIFPKHPELKKIKEKLYSHGALYASMSGSGSAVYGIFESEKKIKKYFSNYHVSEGIL